MKTLKNLSVTALCLMLFSACEKPIVEPSSEHNQQIEPLVYPGKNCKDRKELRTVPFEARFYTIRSYEEGPGSCSEDPFLEYNLQLGEGKATYLGKFTTTIWFCGSGFDYKNGQGVFVAANGDKLYFQIPSPGKVGHILPYDDPFYEFTFQDPFTFTGGTGRFKGVSGSGRTNSFVDLFDDNGDFIPEHKTDHKWVGTLVLPKNKPCRNRPCKDPEDKRCIKYDK